MYSVVRLFQPKIQSFGGVSFSRTLGGRIFGFFPRVPHSTSFLEPDEFSSIIGAFRVVVSTMSTKGEYNTKKKTAPVVPSDLSRRRKKNREVYTKLYDLFQSRNGREPLVWDHIKLTSLFWNLLSVSSNPKEFYAQPPLNYYSSSSIHPFGSLY